MKREEKNLHWVDLGGGFNFNPFLKIHAQQSNFILILF